LLSLTYNPLNSLLDYVKQEVHENDIAKNYLLSRGASLDQITVHSLGSLSTLMKFDSTLDGSHKFDVEDGCNCNTCRLNFWVYRHIKAKESEGISGPSVIFPLTGPSSKVYGVQARSVEKKVFDTFMLDVRPEPIFFGAGTNMLRIFNSGTLVLTEGPMDMLVTERLTGLPTVALTTNSLSRNQSKLLSRTVNRLVCVLDADEAGRAGVKTILDRWSREIECIDVKLSKLDKMVKDPNEAWTKFGDKKFQSFLNQSIARMI